VRIVSRLPFVVAIAGAIALVSLLSPAARAQTDEERAAARAAATEGLRALEAGRYKEALDFCTRAEKLMHAPTHLLLIARTQTKLGHLVEAQEAYIRIQREALAPDAPRAFVDAQAAAAQEQQALAPRVPALKVTVEGALPSDVTLMLDGQRMPSALIGLSWPINPGEHTLSAKSANAASDPLPVTVVEGTTQDLKLTLKPTGSGSNAMVGASGAGGEAGADHPEHHGSTGMRVAGWIAIGVGVAGFVTAGLSTLDNRSDRNAANALCTPQCPDSKRTQIDTDDQNANQAATLAWVFAGVGVVGLATGVTLVLAGGKSSAPAQSGQIQPWVGARSAGITGTF